VSELHLGLGLPRLKAAAVDGDLFATGSGPLRRFDRINFERPATLRARRNRNERSHGKGKTEDTLHRVFASEREGSDHSPRRQVGQQIIKAAWQSACAPRRSICGAWVFRNPPPARLGQLLARGQA
jgi:hypothetical protein